MAKHKLFRLMLAVMGIALLPMSPEVRAANLSVIPKWERFELTLKSRDAYTNALQEAEVRVLFVSPLGETNRTYGFWDGGKTWRVRFAPDFPGRWRYYTMCSDPANRGLHGQTGEFLCSAATGGSRFRDHGPVQVARDHTHFEHADRTPFLWLGDAAWDAATRSDQAGWEHYVQRRAAQKFNVVQWRLAAAQEGQTPAAFSGTECITINLEFFNKLEAKVSAAARAGLLNAIAPLWEIGPGAEPALPEDQAIVLLRYVVARWGGDPVAWILAFESDNTGAEAARWQRIGRAVFQPVTHGPVILLPGEASWVLQEFRSESWVDALGFQTSQAADADTLPWLLKGPLSLERRKVPARPLIALAPAAETGPPPERGKAGNSDFARRLLWWNLLINTPAGVSYSARDVADWTTVRARDMAEQPWRQSLTLPGAGAVAPLVDFFDQVEFWRLEPFPRVLVTPAGADSQRNHIVACRTSTGGLISVYVPDERSVTVTPDAWSTAAEVSWFDPRTGERRLAAAAVIRPTGWELVKPSADDWVLVVRDRK